jgi:hypothetical protein
VILILVIDVLYANHGDSVVVKYLIAPPLNVSTPSLSIVHFTVPSVPEAGIVPSLLEVSVVDELVLDEAVLELAVEVVLELVVALELVVDDELEELLSEELLETSALTAIKLVFVT